MSRGKGKGKGKCGSIGSMSRNKGKGGFSGSMSGYKERAKEREDGVASSFDHRPHVQNAFAVPSLASQSPPSFCYLLLQKK